MRQWRVVLAVLVVLLTAQAGSALAQGATELDISQARTLSRQDTPASLSDHLTWLRDAGFTDVDCSYKDWRYAVLSGRKG